MKERIESAATFALMGLLAKGSTAKKEALAQKALDYAAALLDAIDETYGADADEAIDDEVAAELDDTEDDEDDEDDEDEGDESAESKE
jgi:hypothetical protein